MIVELDFKPHPAGLGGTRAKVQFDNGYGASVITGSMFYTSDTHPYEVAVTLADGSLCYDTPVTSDVLGHLTEGQVQDTLKKIEELPQRA